MQSPLTTNDPSSASFELVKTPWDVRDYIAPVLLVVSLSPLGLSLLAYPACLVVFGIYWGLPPLVRLRWPTFMKANILDDLRINAGASLSLFASITALLLQVSMTECHTLLSLLKLIIIQSHNTSISLAVKVHSEFYSRPLVRLLRTVGFFVSFLLGLLNLAC
jgi:hypothetical protein